jgi:hypothetical protein
MSHAACKVYLLLIESKLLEPKPTVLSVGRAQNYLRKEDSDGLKLQCNICKISDNSAVVEQDRKCMRFDGRT